MLDKQQVDHLVEHEEYLEAGRLFLYTRNGIFQARIYQGDAERRYPVSYTHLTLPTSYSV